MVEPLVEVLKHFFYREMSLDPERLTEGVAFACDEQDHEQVYQSVFKGI